MKFLSFPALDKASTTLEGIDLGDIVLTGKLEAYSCKRAGEDKKLQKIISDRIHEDIERRRKRGNSLDTQIGPLDSPQTQRILTFMITTLNASFPDYDFSSLNADQFEKFQHRNTAIDSINMSVVKPVSGVVNGFQNEVWQAVAEAIDYSRCEILSLVVDPDSMIFAKNKLWTMCYFFYNPALKRILLFFCAAKSKLSLPSNQMGGSTAGGRVDDGDGSYSDLSHHHNHHHHHNNSEDEGVNDSMRSRGEDQFDLMEEESEFGDVSDVDDDDEDLGIGGTGSAALDHTGVGDVGIQSNIGLTIPRAQSRVAAVGQRGGGAIVDVAMLDWDDTDAHRTVLFLPDLPNLAPTFMPVANNPNASSNAGSHSSTPLSTSASPGFSIQGPGSASSSGSGLMGVSAAPSHRVPNLSLSSQASLTRVRPVNPVTYDRWPKRIEIDAEIKSPHTFSERFGSSHHVPPLNDPLPTAALSSSKQSSGGGGVFLGTHSGSSASTSSLFSRTTSLSSSVGSKHQHKQQPNSTPSSSTNSSNS